MFFSCEAKEMAANMPPNCSARGKPWDRALDAQRDEFQAKPILLFSDLSKLSTKLASHRDKLEKPIVYEDYKRLW